MDGDEKRKATVPKGDILHQFRQDVTSGKLPTVSWLVPPAQFSDHPSCPWYGSWYVSEVLEFISKDFKYFDQADFYFNTHAVARKYPSCYKNGQEFKTQSKRFRASEMFDQKVDGTILRSDLYGCKIVISFF